MIKLEKHSFSSISTLGKKTGIKFTLKFIIKICLTSSKAITKVLHQIMSVKKMKTRLIERNINYQQKYTYIYSLKVLFTNTLNNKSSLLEKPKNINGNVKIKLICAISYFHDKLKRIMLFLLKETLISWKTFFNCYMYVKNIIQFSEVF